MSQVDVIRVNTWTAGLLSFRTDGRGCVFYSSDSVFDAIHGNVFANRQAAQQAVDRIASANRHAGSRRNDDDAAELRAIRNAMI